VSGFISRGWWLALAARGRLRPSHCTQHSTAVCPSPACWAAGAAVARGRHWSAGLGPWPCCATLVMATTTRRLLAAAVAAVAAAASSTAAAVPRGGGPSKLSKLSKLSPRPGEQSVPRWYRAAQKPVVPEYTATMPDPKKPLGGIPFLPGTVHTAIFNGSESTGTYSHDAQIERRDDSFHVSWANAAFDEGEDGQRILYSSSADGRRWSAPADIFPAIRAEYFGTKTFPPRNHFGEQALGYIPKPFVTLNDRIYGVANIRPGGGWMNIYPTPPSDLATSTFQPQPSVCIR
jgi:hypothetical protein